MCVKTKIGFSTKLCCQMRQKLNTLETVTTNGLYNNGEAW